jgi:hypothetical protein
MYDLLRDIDQHEDLFPRRTYQNRWEFITFLKMSLIDPSGRHLESASLTRYSQEMHLSARVEPGEWAKLNDAILAAIYLNRTILFVRPNYLETTCMEDQWQYNQLNIRRGVEAYFPDGDIMVIIFV